MKMKSEGDNGSPFSSLLEDLKEPLARLLIISERMLLKYTAMSIDITFPNSIVFNT